MSWRSQGPNRDHLPGRDHHGWSQIGVKVVRPDGSIVSPSQGPQVSTDAYGSFVVNFSPPTRNISIPV